MLQPFNRKHPALNRPCWEEAFDTLIVGTAITARLRDRAENLSIQTRYHWPIKGSIHCHTYLVYALIRCRLTPGREHALNSGVHLMTRVYSTCTLQWWSDLHWFYEVARLEIIHAKSSTSSCEVELKACHKHAMCAYQSCIRGHKHRLLNLWYWQQITLWVLPVVVALFEWSSLHEVVLCSEIVAFEAWTQRLMNFQ